VFRWIIIFTSLAIDVSTGMISHSFVHGLSAVPTSVQTVTKVIIPKKNTLATTYAIIVERFTIKLKMIGYIVKIVDDSSWVHGKQFR
jgi:hypothetical protein